MQWKEKEEPVLVSLYGFKFWYSYFIKEINESSFWFHFLEKEEKEEDDEVEEDEALKRGLNDCYWN